MAYSLLLKLAIIVGAVLLGFGAGWKTEGAFRDSRELAATNAAEAHRNSVAAKQNEAAQSAEITQEKIRVVTRTITKNVDRIVERPGYAGACFDPDGLQLANGALANAVPDSGQPRPALPATGAP